MKTSALLPLSILFLSLAGCQALRSNVNPDTKLSASRRGFVSKAKPEAAPPTISRILIVLKAR